MLLGGLMVALALVLGGIVAAYPAVGATAYPGCYGMERLGPNLYVEPGLSPEQQRTITEVSEQADGLIRAVYGRRASSPRILACFTDDCYHRIGGGGARGVAVLNRAVLLSPRGITPVIAAHELSHVELHSQLGAGGDEVPQWFDEGLAVLVSEDARYLLPRSSPDRCRRHPRAELPVTLDEWLRAASTDEQVYAEAACRVSRWVDSNGGQGAVPDLIRRLGSGERFTDIVRGP